MTTDPTFDAVVVGAGPAGLNAALVLGRSRRRVLVCTDGKHRNSASQALHGFLSRDGIHPMELLRIGREQLVQYGSIEMREVRVADILRIGDRFEVIQSDGIRLVTRAILLATGLTDQLPEVEGTEALYGRSIFHCPYCDGWEVRDRPIAIYGRGDDGVGLALELTGWSRDLVLCTNGPAEISGHDRQKLAGNGISLCEDPIARLEGTDGILERIVFLGGHILNRRAMFFNLGRRQHSDLAQKLGCQFEFHSGGVVSNRHESTNVPGVFVAGDGAWHSHMAIIAASEGAIAALAINTRLLKEDIHSRAATTPDGPRSDRTESNERSRSGDAAPATPA
jgi:thioredoxin reductase